MLSPENSQLIRVDHRYPSVIERELNIPCSALGGANIALEVAKEQFCEATIGTPSPEDAQLWHGVFDSQMFRVHPVSAMRDSSVLQRLTLWR